MFTSQQVVDKLQANPLLQHTTIRTYDRKLIVSLGDGSTANASEGVDIHRDIQMNFATDDLTTQCAILPERYSRKKVPQIYILSKVAIS